MYILKLKNIYAGIKIIYYGHIKDYKGFFTFPAYNYRKRGLNNKALKSLYNKTACINLS